MGRSSKMMCSREKVTCAIAMLSILVSIVCLVLLITSARQTWVSKVQEAENQEVCLPCTTLPEDKVVRAEWRKQEDGQSCCTHDLTKLSQVLGMVLKRKQANAEPLPSFDPYSFSLGRQSAHKILMPSDNSLNTESLPTHDPHRFSLGRASAHKVLMPSENFLRNTNKPESGENDPLFFKHDRDVNLWEHANNVEVTREGFRILVSGWYHVYSNVIFRSDSNKQCKDNKEQTWVHKVIKTNVRDRANSGPILQSDPKSSSSGGVFYLEADDFLHVEVTDEELISYNNHASYMGVTMIS